MGPWTQYQTEEQGPWTQYAPNPAPAPSPRPQQRAAQPRQQNARSPAQSGGVFDDAIYQNMIAAGLPEDEARRYASDYNYMGEDDSSGGMNLFGGPAYADAPEPQISIDAGNSQENPIDLRNLTNDTVPRLTRGTWVQNGDEVYQLPGDAFTSTARESDEAIGGNVFIRRPNMQDRVGAFIGAASEQIPFLDESIAATAGLVSGRGYGAARETQQNAAELLNQTNRAERNFGGVAGFATGLAAPGSALINRGGNLLSRSARAAGVGAGYGALYEAGAGEGNISERAPDAGRGAVIGGLTGAALPTAARVASAAGETVGRPVGRALNRITGGNVPGLRSFGADRQAASRLGQALRNDGATPEQVREVLNDFMRTGVSGSLLDAAQRIAPGGETARLIRGVAMTQGPASTAAEQYARSVAGNLQDDAIRLTRNLTPDDSRSAQRVVDDLTTTRNNLATQQYAAPYAERVTPTEEALAAISGDPGRAALRRARASAEARQDAAQVAEIDSLIAHSRAVDQRGPNVRIPAPEVSGATLDRVRIAMQGRGARMSQSPDTRDIASGLFQRGSALDDALDAVPGLTPARETYRNLTRQIDAVEEGGRGLTAAPESFRFDDAVRPSAQVGYREALETAIGRPTEGATGVLNRIGTSTNQTRNLNEVFGEGAAEYQEGIRNLIDRMANARFIASSSGSQTAPRLADQALAEGGAFLSRGVIGNVVNLLGKVVRGATLTRAEREAIVRLGVSDAVERIRMGGGPVSGRAVVPAVSQTTRLVE